jgi:opacity protein-like surface antigen
MITASPDRITRPLRMEMPLKNFLLSLAMLSVSAGTAFCQGSPTTSRAGDLQIGGGYTSANSDYVVNRISGFAFYSDFDFREHFGVEVDFHQASDPKSTQVYERTYEVGARYVRHYGRVAPYAKILVGRGVFNFPLSEANLAYNMGVLGGGLDLTVHPRINVRADFEFQDWEGFPPNGLTPTLITIGVAYHFSSGRLALEQ